MGSPPKPSNNRDTPERKRSVEKVAASPGGAELYKPFQVMLEKLEDWEFSSCEERFNEQMDIFHTYLENNRETIAEGTHFIRLDLSLSLNDHYLTTELEQQEGSAFLSIAQLCSNKTLLKEVVTIIGKEQGESKEALLQTYVDRDGYNLLHLLADIIIRKCDAGRSILEKDWEAWKYFIAKYPALADRTNSMDQTPSDMIEESTPLGSPPTSAGTPTAGPYCYVLK
ncbi:hypothetical protein F4821DRAFT_42126 [Hypoxylon rubiginosum]|uniref:Uncharacterized protein n=1 Tax=Hypoxylon rubiginosum TaxID=110542 RepID=A0ACC0CKQ0_9PEZI|nr:hypothetical protein F4821DRAFT_42126 [Hypoxylon rubiginosum]